jgi:hypothetical protein
MKTGNKFKPLGSIVESNSTAVGDIAAGTERWNKSEWHVNCLLE